jgi:hypothetical protein
MDRKIQQKTHFSKKIEKEGEELHSNQPLIYVFFAPFSPRVKHNKKSPRGTFSVKFGIFVRQTTIFRGVLDNCPNHFLSPYYYLII